MSFKESLKKIVSELHARNKYLHGAKGKIEQPYQKLKQWHPNHTPGEIFRVTGLTGMDLSWFLFCLGKYTLKDLNTIMLDNRIIDKLKEKHVGLQNKDTDSGFKKFFKNLEQTYPRTAARLKLWMLYTLFAGMTIGGVKIIQHQDRDDVDEDNTEFVDNYGIPQQMTFAEYKEKMSPITPWLIAELIAAEGVVLDEQGLHKPYQDGNNIWTIGFGNTRLKDGSPVTENTPHMTNEEAYELARWHLEEKETYFDLFCYGAYDENLLPKNTGEAFGLSSIVYNSATKFIENKDDKNHRNRFEALRNKYQLYGDSITDSIVKEIFDKYPIVNKCSFGKAWIDSGKPADMAKAIGLYMKDGGGMHWRRWLEAGLITGDITPEDLLECPVKGMYDFYLYMGGWQKGKNAKKFSLWEQTDNGIRPKKSTYREFKKWLQNPKTRNKKTGQEEIIVRKKVKDFLPDIILQECEQGKCEIGCFIDTTSTKSFAFNRGIEKIKKSNDKNLIMQHIGTRNV